MERSFHKEHTSTKPLQQLPCTVHHNGIEWQEIIASLMQIGFESSYHRDFLIATQTACRFDIYVGGSKSNETSRISPQIYNGIIPNLYRVCNYHFLVCQCCQNDAVRSEVHDVIVWWRHATVTRSKKRPKLYFPSEVPSPTFIFHVAVIFSRL